MKKRNSHSPLMRRLALCLALLLCSLQGGAALSDKYTDDNPLTVVCDWELPPYEFLDDEGIPSGYIVDLVDVILNRLGLPHHFVLGENPMMIARTATQKADLFLVSSYMVKEDDWHLTANVVGYYKVKIASRADATVYNILGDIPTDKLLVLRLDGRIVAPMLQSLDLQPTVELHAPTEALSGISSGKYDYFIWGEEPLKWKIKELNLENLRLGDIDVLPAEMRFGGRDRELVNAVDDQYARLEQSGDLDILRDKWFHPERHHDNASPIYLYSAIAAVLLLLVLALIQWLVRRRVKKMTRRNSEQTRLMNMALDMGRYMVTEYDPKQDVFKNRRGSLMPGKSNLDAAVASLHPDDVPAFMGRVEELRQKEVTSSELMVRRADGTDAHHWQYLSGSCIKERDEDTHRTTFLLVAKDITKDMDEQYANAELAVKYKKAFDSSLVAMSFYGKDGMLLDMNNRMKEVIGVNDENLEFFYETPLFEAPLFRGVLYQGMTEIMHACQHMYYPDLHLDKYLEYRIRPVVGEENVTRYYVVTVRDVTAERNLYREQQTIELQMKVTSEEVNKFESQLYYLLSNCNMFIFRTDYKRNIIRISRSLSRADRTITLDDYIASVTSEESRAADAILNAPELRGKSINLVRHYAHSPLTGREAWFAVNGTPIIDKNGEAIGHFGVTWDVTDLVRTKEELRQETERAQQSGQLKATFLANMTHEIRTPLNAIVGFSDLLHVVEAPEERQEFIRIIRHNCGLLLRLIDDILETSTMTDKPQRIEPEDTDFARFFDEVFQSLGQRVQEPGVSFLKDNPYETFPARIDKERIQQVITNFVTNAVKYTKHGHIKVGYKATTVDDPQFGGDGIWIYCEDTGTGIPKDKQAFVFDRFVKLNDYVQGTGLGLAICKSIAERCGGSIGLTSEGEGKGCTFWIWIPRHLTSSNLTAEK